MKTYILLSEKSWHDDLFDHLKKDIEGNWVRISRKEDFTKEALIALKPDLIFIPHWSYLIPESIFDKFECIVFHMTDLPFGRGGSPLQNLIAKGFDQTIISALKVDTGLDTGDIYLKKPLSLIGTAEEIFIRSVEVIEEMIRTIIKEAPVPQKQQGEPLVFKRRTPADGDIKELKTLEQVYDYIRMLDCEGYPNAFLELGEFRFEFSRASLKANKSIIADVRITKK